MYPGLSSAAIAAPTGDGGDRRGTSGGNRAERGRRERKKEKICEIDNSTGGGILRSGSSSAATDDGLRHELLSSSEFVRLEERREEGRKKGQFGHITSPAHASNDAGTLLPSTPCRPAFPATATDVPSELCRDCSPPRTIQRRGRRPRKLVGIHRL
uniref:Uncharacterized protein n=1 Tax=Oryza sativa subsp. japonica TaxID=39947 RepID=Q6H407_ORYSJ|nr:hypothetical protein [Oryza sativa Japonica Group]